MRQNITIALLAVCATLLGVQLVRSFTDSGAAPAFGQSVGSSGETGYVLATGMSSSGSNNILYIFEPKEQKLAAYTVQSNGIEFKGVRQVTWDLKPEEYTKGRASVEAMRKAFEEQSKKKP